MSGAVERGKSVRRNEKGQAAEGILLKPNTTSLITVMSSLAHFFHPHCQRAPEVQLIISDTDTHTVFLHFFLPTPMEILVFWMQLLYYFTADLAPP